MNTLNMVNKDNFIYSSLICSYAGYLHRWVSVDITWPAISAIIVSFVTKLVWGKENLVHTVCVYAKIPRNSHSFVKYHIPCNDRALGTCIC